MTARWRRLGRQWRLGLRSNSHGDGPTYRGNPSTRRGRGDDPDLSLIRAQTTKNPNEIERGIKLGFEMNPIRI
jgi:hypothetical protein